MSSELALIFIIALGAAFVHAIAGFGSALISMPLISWLVGVQMAAPLVALLTLTIELPLLLYYRHSLNLRALAHITVGAVIGVPVGVLALRLVPEEIILGLLGVMLIAYALYALVVPNLPTIVWRGWAYIFGFMSGCSSGAYNTIGPPIIIYGTLRNWPRDQFKSNLQGFFVFIGTIVALTHLASGNLIPSVLQKYAWSIPAIVLGLFSGVALDRWFEPERFRQAVLLLILALGLWMLL